MIEIPITEKHRGGFGVRLTVLRDHQLITLSQAVFVPWDDKELKVSFATFRDRLRPGQTETWTVRVGGPKGASLEDPAKLFNASLEGNARRAIDLHEGDTIDATAFKALIREAVKQNRTVAASRRGGKR